MKRIMIDLRHKMGLLLLMMLTGGAATAQSTGDNLSESDNYTSQNSFWSMYNSPLPYIIYGVIMVGMAYVLYRYWHDNRHHDDVPHHQ